MNCERSQFVVSISIVENPKQIQVSFEHDEYQVDVGENVAIGSDLFRAKVNIFPRSRINVLEDYNVISGNLDNRFKIESHTGIISLLNPLDYEIVDRYKLVVIVCVNISSFGFRDVLRRAITVVTFNVVDVNEFVPIFSSRSRTNFVTVRNGTNNTYLFTAKAIDNDAGLFGRVEYRIIRSAGEEHSKCV